MNPCDVRRLLRNERAKTAQRMRAQRIHPSFIAKSLNVDQATVYNYFKLHDLDNHRVTTLGSAPRITTEVRDWICNASLDKVVCTQAELANEASEHFGVPVSRQSVSNILRNHGITRKRVTMQAEGQFQKLDRHLEFHRQLLQLPNGELAAMDESSFWLNDGPRYGWSRRGTAAFHVRSRNRGTKITLALCISMLPRNGSCLVGYALYDKSMTSDKFLDFMHVMAQGWRSGSETKTGSEITPMNVILDNGSFHGPPGSLVNPHRPTPTVSTVQSRANQLGIKFLYIRPLSPQFNPVEYVFSTIKRAIQRKCCKTRLELVATIKDIVENLDCSSIFNTFKHCRELSRVEFERIQSLGTAANSEPVHKVKSDGHNNSLDAEKNQLFVPSSPRTPKPIL